MNLQLEVNASQVNETPVLGDSGSVVMLTPLVGEEYWRYRVKVSDNQAVLGFPKFTTVGIGFAQEEDWNTNFPYTRPAEEIFKHIQRNKGDENIPDGRVIEAIRMIQEATAPR